MENQFKVGDRVVIMTGGPDMTVTYVSESGGTIGATWFCKDTKDYKYKELPPAALIKRSN